MGTTEAKLVDIDAVIWAMCAEDLLRAAAEDELPAPPPVPAFAAETVRPGRAA